MINILVTIDANYKNPLKVMLYSLFTNHPGESFSIYLIHQRLPEDDLRELDEFTEQWGHLFIPVRFTGTCFDDAPVVMHYTKEMYFRLLACKILPGSVNKILYLDPDLLVINSIRELYDICLDGYLFAAACHDKSSLKEINRYRLHNYEMEQYYNSGVLLMNLALQRKKIREQEIFDFVEKNKSRLILPDQDILNSLYFKEIRPLNDLLYNLDPRYYRYYKMTSRGAVDMDFIIEKTAILHFCGKRKPWKKNYYGPFHSLYKHYEKQALRAQVCSEVFLSRDD